MTDMLSNLTSQTMPSLMCFVLREHCRSASIMCLGLFVRVYMRIYE